MSDLTPDLFPGDVVANRYQIEAAIGIGGSGTVYRARSLDLSQRIALKVMHSEHPDNAAERQRFAREAEMVKRLQHPHVVPLLDYGHTDDGVPFLVFTLLEGCSLEAKVKRQGALGWQATAKFSDQILRALEKAHGLNIVHRDIKPANIFMSTGVLGEVAQVLDFGLAKVVGKGANMDVTVAGSLLGTPRYMAPEQVRGQELGQAADIYSFGLVMAEMLIGRPLVDGKTEMEIFAMQGSDVPLTIPAEIQASPFGPIVERAVSKTVSVRYRLASQMLADLRAAMARIGESPEDGPENADLEATAILDPNNLPLSLRSVSNPTAEKLRQVFNTMAVKAASDEEAMKLDQAAARMRRPPPPIEDEESETEYPQSWTGERRDSDEFGVAHLRGPDIELDDGRAGAEGRNLGSVPPGERPFAAVGGVPAAGGARAPSSRRPPLPAAHRPASSWPPRSQPPQSWAPIPGTDPPPRSIRDPRLAPTSKSSKGLVVALVFVLLAVAGVGAFGARLLGLL